MTTFQVSLVLLVDSLIAIHWFSICALLSTFRILHRPTDFIGLLFIQFHWPPFFERFTLSEFIFHKVV